MLNADSQTMKQKLKEVKKFKFDDAAPANSMLCVRNLIVWIGSFKNIYLYQQKVGSAQYVLSSIAHADSLSVETLCKGANSWRTQPPHHTIMLCE